MFINQTGLNDFNLRNRFNTDIKSFKNFDKWHNSKKVKIKLF